MLKVDKYDKAMAYLFKHPEKIPLWWSHGRTLFQLVPNSGCLTMIRNQRLIRPETPLEKEIAADTRLPDSPTKITTDHLPIFAEWQRRIDRELGREDED